MRGALEKYRIFFFFFYPSGFTTPQEVAGAAKGDPHFIGGETETRGLRGPQTWTRAWGFGFKPRASLLCHVSPLPGHIVLFCLPSKLVIVPSSFQALVFLYSKKAWKYKMGTSHFIDEEAGA